MKITKFHVNGTHIVIILVAIKKKKNLIGACAVRSTKH